MTQAPSPTQPNPCYVLSEERLCRNLELIAHVMKEGNVNVILAFKAFALWKSFPLFRHTINSTASSSPYEARMAYEKFGARTHTYSPAYEDATFERMLRYSSHLTFNSLSQYAHFSQRVARWNAGHAERVSLGLRINPEYSEIATALYNPCAPESRFGILAADMPTRLPQGVEGLHVHTHCESDSYALERSWAHIKAKFAPWLSQAKWLNLGGGHLMTAANYNVPHLLGVLQSIHAEYPHLQLIMEPGSAFLWQTGELYARVVDVVSNRGIKTAILNVSFTCHMPDCLEMPYRPTVVGAQTLDGEPSPEEKTDAHVYRLGGNSCLSGDSMGYWRFEKPLHVGDEVVFLDMLHYTTVKTNMFNGIAHPAIAIRHTNGETEVYRTFSYEDYLGRMC